MNVVVIAPHPDDESLGVGGTILRHKSENDKVSCIFVTCAVAKSSCTPTPPHPHLKNKKRNKTV
jgi:LmbE family N-acetylglucosaminyl deacetylase